MQSPPIGAVGHVARTITEDLSAASMKSGALPVFATPAVIALMEEAAMDCAAPYVEEGETTVGTMVNIQHVAASRVGMRARAEATLRDVQERRLIFDIAAYDDAGLIAQGTHERFAVRIDRFMAKLAARGLPEGGE